jgi:hypothetical protein
MALTHESMNIEDLKLIPEEWVCKKQLTENRRIYYIVSKDRDAEGTTVPIPTASSTEEWQVMKITNGEKEYYLLTNDPNLEIQLG